MTKPTNWNLPTTADIKRLSLRCVVAYAARTAYRLSPELRGIIPDEAIDNVLAKTNEVCLIRSFEELDEAAIVLAAADLAGAMSTVKTSADKHVIATCLQRSAMAATMVLEVADDPTRANRCMSYAARSAQAAVSAVRVLSDERALVAAKSARDDYQTLLKQYGDHDVVIIGDPIDCFNDR